MDEVRLEDTYACSTYKRAIEHKARKQCRVGNAAAKIVRTGAGANQL
jgi:hypothetical protein